MLATVALVEDDVELRDRVIGPGLTTYGFRVRTLVSGDELFRLLNDDCADVVVVDINLPGDSGLSIIQRLRLIGSTIGIIALSGHQIDGVGTTALQVGADMYLMKPAKVDLLASALHAVLRRTRAPRTDEVKGKPVVTDDWYVSTPSGDLVALTQNERIIMSLLRAAEGAPVRREMLVNALTDFTEEFDPQRLEVIIHRLRKKLSQAAQYSRFDILTMRGIGYALTGKGHQTRSGG